MQGTFFEFDLLAFFFIVLFCIGFFFLFKTATIPALFFSNLTDLKAAPKSLKAQCAHLPRLLEFIALFLFIAAFIDPHVQIAKNNPQSSLAPSEGIAIYLILDRSGSMNDKITTYSTSRKRINKSKLELLKEVTAKFIKGDPNSGFNGRPNDLIGLVVFARSADIISPLTLDHTLLLEKLPQITVPHSEEEDGTAIGYAIFKTVNLIAATRHYANDLIGSDLPAYDIKNAIILLVTDGLQAPNPLDQNNALRSIEVDEAAEYAKKNHVKLYIINLEPRLVTEALAPFRRQMERITELTGGKLYILGSSDNLEQMYREIDQLEKSPLPEQERLRLSKVSKDQLPQFYQRISFYPYLIALGMLLLFTALLLKTTILRKIP